MEQIARSNPQVKLTSGRTMKRIILAMVGLVVLGVASAQPKLDSLLVYGQGFAFSVKEPEGWMSDTEHAGAYQANALFYPKVRSWKETDGLIRVRVGDKSDERVEEDLGADADGYRKQYPSIEFRELAVSHPEYRVYSKVFVVPNGFYEYVAYVNPGPASKYMFSVAMNKQKRTATKSELAAFGKVVASLHALGAPQQVVPADSPHPAGKARR